MTPALLSPEDDCGDCTSHLTNDMLTAHDENLVGAELPESHRFFHHRSDSFFGVSGGADLSVFHDDSMVAAGDADPNCCYDAFARGATGDTGVDRGHQSPGREFLDRDNFRPCWDDARHPEEVHIRDPRIH